jgi:hypothetical protein
MRTLFVLLSLILLSSCGNPKNDVSDIQLVDQLENLIEIEDYFKLNAVYTKNMSKLSNMHSLYYSALINNLFNQSEESNKDIELLLNEYSTGLSDTMLNKLYHKKLWNHINLYEYEQAAKTSDFIQNNYLALNDSIEIEKLKNEIKIWKAIVDVPKQEVIKTGDVTIPLTKDKVGLLNIDVIFNDSIKNMIFDTGANFSFIKKSLAEELGYEIIDANFYVTASTGKKVKSDIAIADELIIGNLVFKNVFFLVIDDANLSFPQIEYYVNGAIGFPVIEAMDEIRINNDNQIFVPKNPVEYNYNNFALNGLMPIISVVYKEDSLRMNFDTGALATSLYPKFYKDYKDEITNNYEKVTFTSVGGGGMIEFEGYVINDITLKTGGSEARLDSLKTHIEHIDDENSNFHGSFGQDYIKQFDEMILSFKYSSIIFK